MAYRVVSSQADPDPAQNTFTTTDVNSFFDLDSPSIFTTRPFFNNPWAHPPTPPNANSFNILDQQLHPNQQQQQQYYSNHQLPSLPSLPELFTDRHLSDAIDPFQQANNFMPNYRYRNLSPPATSRSHGRERSSWASGRQDSAFAGLDPGPRRPTPVTYVEHNTVVAPPQAQQPRTPSSTFHGARSTLTQLPQPSRFAPEPNGDDHYLAALAEGDFSSPSLPPINSSPLPPTRPQSSNLPKPLEIGEVMPTINPCRRGTRREHLVDLTKEEPDLHSVSSIDPATPTMPAITRKRGATAVNSEAQPTPPKRRRGSRSTPSTSGRVNKSRLKQAGPNPFSDDDHFSSPGIQDVHESIDLSNATEEVPQELMAPKVDTRVKIGKFQCVICMDDASSLAVTHCGHLFCSECLHSALHIDNMKKTCPVCRTKVDPKEKKGKNLKSFYHLELKILTANKKGKRPAGP